MPPSPFPRTAAAPRWSIWSCRYVRRASWSVSDNRGQTVRLQTEAIPFDKRDLVCQLIQQTPTDKFQPEKYEDTVKQRILEQIGRKGRVLFINDSKGTNADDAARALSSFGDIFWIAGGKPKTGGIEPLREFFPRIRKAYLIGEAAEAFAATLGQVPHEISKDLETAVPHAARDAAASGLKEPVVLLSPACASFYQFPNFEKRGERFGDLVLALGSVTPVKEASS